MRLAAAFCVAQLPGDPARAQAPPGARELPSGTRALLQAVSAVDERTVWASGHEGVVLRSLDGGETWERRPAPAGDSLQFRDVHGFDAERAVILSAGEGDASRVYRTEDGGATWTLSWMNPEPEGFYDCLDFWDARRGVLYGDAVAGRLRVLLTSDGGATWERVPDGRLPAALEGEGGFAASGTCVTTGPGGRAWIATGAGSRPRVLRTDDFGHQWSATDVPLVTGPQAGAFTIVFRDANRGMVLGGDLGTPAGVTSNVAVTTDGGVSWRTAGGPPFAGPVYGSAAPRRISSLVAVGPGGVAERRSDGVWRLLDGGSWWAVGAAGVTAWAVGPRGRVLKLSWGESAPP